MSNRYPPSELQDQPEDIRSAILAVQEKAGFVPVTAFFGLSDRMASFSGMLPDTEFYRMGRQPRQKEQTLSFL